MARAISEKADAEKQRKGFIAKFDSKHQAVIRAARKAKARGRIDNWRCGNAPRHESVVDHIVADYEGFGASET